MPASSSKETTPTKSMRSRMGTLLRRSSSAISFTRPGNASRRASQESLKIEPPVPDSTLKLPSPVPESPAVEPGASRIPVGPSPLTAPPGTASSPIDVPPKSPPPEASWGDGPIAVTPDALSTTSADASHDEHVVPSTLAEESALPLSHADTDGSSQVETSQPSEEVIPDRQLDSSPAEAELQEPEPVLSPPAIAIQAPSPIAEKPESTPLNEPQEPVDPVEKRAPIVSELTGASSASSTDTTEASPSQPSVIERAPSTGQHSMSHNPWAVSEPTTTAPIIDPVTASVQHSPSHSGDQVPPVSTPDMYEDSATTTPRPLDYAHPQTMAETIDQTIEAIHRSRASTVSSQARPLTPPPAMSPAGTSGKTSIAPSAGEQADRVVIIDHGEPESDLPSIGGSYTDPFEETAQAPSEVVYIRQPAAFDPAPEEPTAPSTGPHSYGSAVQGGPQWNIIKQPSADGYEMGETAPLLGPSSGQHGIAYDPEMLTDFKRLGWRMHVLPDTSVYFTHPNLHVVSDIDLRRSSTMHEVSECLGASLVPPHGWEVWLRRTRKSDNLPPEHFWVHHEKRAIVQPSLQSAAAMEESITSEADKLNMEKLYWRYVEMHPAHLVLSANAIGEATDILSWAYSDRLLPSSSTNHGKSPAFSQHECQELSNILHSLDVTDSPSNSLVRTRVVAKIMLRMCLWRLGQLSPSDYDRHRVDAQPRGNPSFGRRVADVAITALCLGIPMFFSNRSPRADHGGAGTRSAAGSMLVIGAVACMIAAVILGASVTLISIPGINEMSRIASFISIVLSASSLVSAILALFQWKTAIERQTAYDIPGEGMLFVSRRSILLSLPLVFLLWAIAAFITGIALHMLRGLFENSSILPRNVQKYVHWAVVGTVGGLVGTLVTCGLILL